LEKLFRQFFVDVKYIVCPDKSGLRLRRALSVLQFIK
jgi:hypothetical protein